MRGESIRLQTIIFLFLLINGVEIHRNLLKAT
jgi:hypothetical protein